MYSSEGLADWELVVVSGLFAVSIMAISALIGSLVAFIALREPKVVARTISSKEAIPSNGISTPLPTIPSAA